MRDWRGKRETSKPLLSRKRWPMAGSAGSLERGREVARRIHERPARARHGEAQGVVDRAAAHLVVAREPGKDRQPGGVGGGPAARAQPVRAQVPDRAGAGAPARPAVLGIGREQLEEAAARAVHDDHVPVAVGSAAALHRRARRDRVAAPVRLVRVVEAHRHALLPARHGHVGNADRPAVPEPRAEVGVHVVASAPMLRTIAAEPASTGQPVHARVPLARAAGTAGSSSRSAAGGPASRRPRTGSRAPRPRRGSHR